MSSLRNIRYGIYFCIILQSCQTGEENQHHQLRLFSLLSPKETGVNFQNLVVENENYNHLNNDMIVAGAGVAVGDINNDSLPDLYFAGNQVPDRLYLNLGNLKFKDITQSAGIGDSKTWSAGVTMADVNNDGLLDIYVCKSVQGKPQLSENLLYINNGPSYPKGEITFTEKAIDYGLSDRGFSVQAVFFDADRDGLLDMYLVNQPPSLGKRTGGATKRLNEQTVSYSDKLYWNKGNGKFKDVTLEAGMLNLAYGLSATVGDFNNDGWPDIYVANDFDRPDYLYINNGDGTFKNQINQALKHITNFSMGTDVADYDNDGLLDIMVVDMVAEDHKRIKTNMGGMNPKNFWRLVNNRWHYQYMFNTLQRNNGNGTFSELAHLAGISNTDWSWGPLLADFDNDGWKDLFVTNGIKKNLRYTDLNQQVTRKLDSLELIAEKEGKDLKEVIDIMEFVEMTPTDRISNYIFKNNGDLVFIKKNKEWGIDVPSLSNGGAYADLDMDGDLDLVVNNVDEYAFVYRNNSELLDRGNYLRIKVLNSLGSPAYGARVILYKNDQLWQVQELTNVRGYMSKSEDVLHFGLGEENLVEEVMIQWPQGKTYSLKEVPSNQLLWIGPSSADILESPVKEVSLPFREVTKELNINYKHKENQYNDYLREVLLPHKMSNFGPGLAVGDVNADDLEDFYVGGASEYPGAMFIQSPDGTFYRWQQDIWEEDKMHEDLGAELFDSDNDGDLDLYVVSGGNEFEVGSELLQDRLYLNDGSGNFYRSKNALPQILTSGSCVETGDYDGDGDMDLFVGGRLVPGQYPLPASSHILRNEGGRFVDVTGEIAPGLQSAGLVTAAAWTDFSGDGNLDLVIVGEWMPISLWENKGDEFVNVTNLGGLSETTGWYYSVSSEDMDGDGDMDLIAGNLGLNYKYKASKEAPFEIYSHDFDDNGKLDIVLGYYEHGEIYPLRGKSCSTDQLPMLQEKFPTYESFGNANLRDVYGEGLDVAINYKAQTFASNYLENKGDGKFEIHPLPNGAQVSSINKIIIKDFNEDGHKDLLMAGNLYPVEIETPRNDANMGMYLTGDGKGNFEIVPLTKSGFFAPHDTKDMELINLGKGKDMKTVILVANNKYRMQAILHTLKDSNFKNPPLVSYSQP
ncbi:MAG: CRTAC1 family protein [Bacteroidetes bacterium]|nr:CRTAC1 family protein [Bacteroidota bacterium]